MVNVSGSCFGTGDKAEFRLMTADCLFAFIATRLLAPGERKTFISLVFNFQTSAFSPRFVDRHLCFFLMSIEYLRREVFFQAYLRLAILPN